MAGGRTTRPRRGRRQQGQFGRGGQRELPAGRMVLAQLIEQLAAEIATLMAPAVDARRLRRTETETLTLAIHMPMGMPMQMTQGLETQQRERQPTKQPELGGGLLMRVKLGVEKRLIHASADYLRQSSQR